MLEQFQTATWRTHSCVQPRRFDARTRLDLRVETVPANEHADGSVGATRRSACVTWLLVLLGIAAAAAGAQAQETGRVRGTVRFASRELPRATVQLKDSTGKVREAVTDEQGAYEFANLAAGSYSLTVKDPKSEWGQGLPPVPFDQQAHIVTIAPGEAATVDLAVRLKAIPLPSGFGVSNGAIEFPLCGSFPNGPSLVTTADGMTIRMRPGDPPLKIEPAQNPNKIEKPQK